MEPRLNFYKASPDAMKAMAGLEQHIAKCGLEKPLSLSPSQGLVQAPSRNTDSKFTRSVRPRGAEPDAFAQIIPLSARSPD